MPRTPSPHTALLAALLLTAGSSLPGCESDAQTGALLGAGIGALAGQAIGGDSKGTLIGAAVGGGTGYLIGNQSDKNDAKAPRRAVPTQPQIQSKPELSEPQ